MSIFSRNNGDDAIDVAPKAMNTANGGYIYLLQETSYSMFLRETQVIGLTNDEYEAQLWVKSQRSRSSRCSSHEPRYSYSRLPVAISHKDVDRLRKEERRHREIERTKEMIRGVPKDILAEVLHPTSSTD